MFQNIPRILTFGHQSLLALTPDDVLQGRESRKHPANGAWSGETGGLWFCFYHGSSQLLRRDAILVSVRTQPAVFCPELYTGSSAFLKAETYW